MKYCLLIKGALDVCRINPLSSHYIECPVGLLFKSMRSRICGLSGMTCGGCRACRYAIFPRTFAQKRFCRRVSLWTTPLMTQSAFTVDQPGRLQVLGSTYTFESSTKL